ncbi:hypothetical protein C2W62_54150, partial [Candidatus Entotheonella serta]
DPLDVKGNLEIVGSATVTPVIQQLYKRFILEVYRGLIKLRSVERAFSWLYKYRRLNKDYEFLTQSSESMLYIAMTHLMVRRI